MANNADVFAHKVRGGLAALVVAGLLAACGGDGSDVAATIPDPEPPVQPDPGPARNPAYLDAKAGDIIQVKIKELHPTQAAIGYDQVYYKLGRWQGDFDRGTWRADPVSQLDYLNRTVGKKFDDYCEDMGATARVRKFQTIDEARQARLNAPGSFACEEAFGTHADVLKTAVVGWDGDLYLTDGHHTFSALRGIADGGPELPVWVKVAANYSDVPTREAFWQRMIDERKAWLRDGDDRPITTDQLPSRVGMASDEEPGGMQEDAYRSLVYFTRDIGYASGGLPEFAEFQWASLLRARIAAGQLAPLSGYKTAAPAPLAAILAVSTLKADLSRAGATDSYAAAVREASLVMGALGDQDVVYDQQTASQLGRIQLVPDAASNSPTKTARDTLEELPRDDVKKDGTPRGAGKLWFSVNYRTCGKPAAGTCWGY
ncbi:MAG: chromosome partitioning protein ParB [Alcaligenaceae bacterium]|nr:chromosome partitioning protein ParB [Alcaligenaceae bacterium SAGV5]MPS52516.1 chromosome partitioning protein ParB [Alcaligenaceae bacterium SAGV3]MPT60401.1 chromosome partitioning protein ParB [Alcaligenaceae bacterium]